MAAPLLGLGNTLLLCPALLFYTDFWLETVIENRELVLLAVGSLISLTGFGGNKLALRAVHAYLGTTALALMVLHAAFGLKLGLSI